MKAILFTFLFCAIFISQNTFSQVGDISTDRPDQSESPYLMDKGYFQVEAGVTSENDEPVKDFKTNTLSAPSILLRYGIAKNVELRGGIEIINSKTTIGSTSTSENGMGPILAGTKNKALQRKRFNARNRAAAEYYNSI